MNRPAFVLFVASALLTAQEPEPEPAKVPSPTVIVRGHLLDASFAPAVGVPVTRVRADEVDYRSAIRSPLARSDEHGRFEVRVERGAHDAVELLVGGDKYAVHVWTVDEQAEQDVGTVALARGFLLTGRVRTADDGPLDDVVVTGTDLLATRSFLYCRAGGKTLAPRTRGRVARGIFVLPGALQSAGTVRVSCPGYYTEVVEPTGVGLPCEVTLSRAPIVRGRVVDKSGDPVPDQVVRCGDGEATTAADGTFELQPTSRVAQTVFAIRQVAKQPQQASAALGRGDEPIELRFDVDLEATPGMPHLIVRAVDADGAAIESFAAYVSWHHQNQLQWTAEPTLLGQASRTAGWHATTTTGTAELDTFVQPHQAQALVYVKVPGRAWGRRVADADAVGKPLSITVHDEVALRGRVVDAKTGDGLAGVRLVPCPRMTRQAREYVLHGYFPFADAADSPFTVATDEQGAFRLEHLPAEELDVFVSIGGHIIGDVLELDLRDGPPKEPLKIEIPATADLIGKLEVEGPPGLRVHLHRLRDNMAMSLWQEDMGGSVPLADDGTFSFRGAAPVTFVPELLLPAPPRSPLMHKIALEQWAADAPPETYRAGAPQFDTVTGNVAGEVPWSRLAVLSLAPTPNAFYQQFSPPCVLSMLEPDRSYRQPVPVEPLRFVLVDVLTGIPLAWRDFDADDLRHPLDWRGNAVERTLTLHGADAERPLLTSVQYTPVDEHWPIQTSPFLGNEQRTGMLFSMPTGTRQTLYLPERSGTLTITFGDHKLEIDLEQTREERFEVDVAEGAVQLRAN